MQMDPISPSASRAARLLAVGRCVALDEAATATATATTATLNTLEPELKQEAANSLG